MLRFFRQIRLNLMTHNNSQRYLLYALGEIFLVVIGILIALQVNNWNEDRKNRRYEVMALAEIRKAIIADLEFFENHYLKYRIKQKKEADVFFDKIIMNEDFDVDSINHHFVWLKYGSTFQYNRGPYEAIKSAGIDRISNDSLRNKITYMYDFFIPRHEELFEWSVGELEAAVGKYFDYLHDHPEISVVNGKVEISRNPRDLTLQMILNFLTFIDSLKVQLSGWNVNSSL